MSYEKYFLDILVMMLLSTVLLNGCQPSTLYVGEESEPTTKASRTPQAKPGAAAPTTYALSSMVLTSSSDSSPDTKNTNLAASDRDATAQPMANILQDNALASARADTTIAEASGAVARKRPATAPIDQHKDKKPAATKKDKKEASSTAHKAWFTAFADTAKKLAEDTENEEVWDIMEDLLYEGKNNDFLMASMMYPNDSNPITDYEYTPIHYAASIGLLTLVKELVNHEHVPVDIQTQENRHTPLHLASSRGHLDVVQFLVEQGANPHLVDNEEGGALHYAAAGRQGEMNRDVIEYLVARGADFKKKTGNNAFPLGLAVFSGNLPVIEYWEDTYVNSLDPDIDILTNRAINLAKYRRKNIPQERRIQSTIIKILKNFLKARQDKNKGTHAAK